MAAWPSPFLCPLGRLIRLVQTAVRGSPERCRAVIEALDALSTNPFLSAVRTNGTGRAEYGVALDPELPHVPVHPKALCAQVQLDGGDFVLVEVDFHAGKDA